MIKLFSIALAVASLGALSAAPAQAGGCCATASSCCAAAPSCCTTTAPAASADNMQSMPGMSQAPSSTRSYSYEPSMRGNAASPARAPQAPAYLVPKTLR